MKPLKTVVLIRLSSDENSILDSISDKAAGESGSQMRYLAY